MTCFLELDNSICASCSNISDSIYLYDLNNLNNNNIFFQAHSKSVNWIIKSNKNNIISCGNDGLIKIWPIITDNYISQQQKLFNLNKNKNEIYKKNRVNLIPFCEFKLNDSQSINVISMIHLKENNFLLLTKENIFLFKYVIDENNTKIDLSYSNFCNIVIKIKKFFRNQIKIEIFSIYF